MKQLAIIGPTASGKTDLAIELAKKIDAYILSIDSLSIYKEIDIVSAKPTMDERSGIKHFGMDAIYCDEIFSVDIFINIYKQVKQRCLDDSKNLIIVGGTSFYLKSLINGLSTLPNITTLTSSKVKQMLESLDDCYELLSSKDPTYMQNISKNDSYRIEKALLIYEASSITPTEWFKQNPPKPIIQDLDIYNIQVQKEVLKQRIIQRTSKMLQAGLIDEICYLERKYTRLPNAMGAIGIVEVLEYLDTKTSKEEMLQNISSNTASLAKRQQTFNKTQFENITHASLTQLKETLL